MARLLTAKFTGHWYPEDPARGSGFRAIANDCRLDALFAVAAREAGLPDIERLLHHTRPSIMFVNPGVVKVRNLALHSATPAHVVWSSAGQASPQTMSPRTGSEVSSLSPPPSPLMPVDTPAVPGELAPGKTEAGAATVTVPVAGASCGAAGGLESAVGAAAESANVAVGALVLARPPPLAHQS
jgi:hypothetical protein